MVGSEDIGDILVDRRKRRRSQERARTIKKKHIHIIYTADMLYICVARKISNVGLSLSSCLQSDIVISFRHISSADHV